MSGMVDAQADLLAHSGDIGKAELAKGFDTLKYFFAIERELKRWRAGQTHLMWAVPNQTVIFCEGDQAAIINLPDYMLPKGD